MRQLKKRAQFLKAARGRKIVRRGFVLQAVAHNEDCDMGPGIGYTVTKKVGNAPQRNRVKRRLRALSQEFAEKFDPKFNYVLIGRQEALHEPFNELKKSLARALGKIHVERSAASHAIDRKSKS
ncbi:ribonuclease P protein component [Maritalea mobilis]|uniref:Ribonuclease P protein component n=1 Tax=Maritalea mobilis TaxID=483324 RepID=A0A4R6VVH7_9HYPH|nr:ribonuclease P protein component [Maritalea mobilis]TDQ64251.1 ribonuclease P protein component [Maritalea mobilis]